MIGYRWLTAIVFASLALPPTLAQSGEESAEPMQFDQYYLVLLRKGPEWSPERTPESAARQKAHRAHIGQMAEMGKLALAGPTQDLSNDGDLRGIFLFHVDAFADLDELKALVNEDPTIKAKRLRAEYSIWYMPAGAMKIELPKPTP